MDSNLLLQDSRFSRVITVIDGRGFPKEVREDFLESATGRSLWSRSFSEESEQRWYRVYTPFD